MPIWAVNRYRYDRSRPQLAVTPFCAEAIAFATDERLLKLESLYHPAWSDRSQGNPLAACSESS